jgi:hypothetical protein
MVHGDGIRNIEGQFASIILLRSASGAFNGTDATVYENDRTEGGTMWTEQWVRMKASYTVPTANKNQPRAWGALACVYLGKPAS